MNIQALIKRNASTILTSLGAAGVLATAIITAKETPKALSLLEEAKEKKGEKLTKWEKVKIAGPTYIPAIATGAATVACIFGSNVISKRQQAPLRAPSLQSCSQHGCGRKTRHCASSPAHIAKMSASTKRRRARTSSAARST